MHSFGRMKSFVYNDLRKIPRPQRESESKRVEIATNERITIIMHIHTYIQDRRRSRIYNSFDSNNLRIGNYNKETSIQL